MDRVNPLGDLIEWFRDDFRVRNGVPISYDNLAKRGGAVNVETTGARIQQIVRGGIKAMPKPETLEVIAEALGTSLWNITALALLSSGYDVPQEQLGFLLLDMGDGGRRNPDGSLPVIPWQHYAIHGTAPQVVVRMSDARARLRQVAAEEPLETDDPPVGD